MVEPTILLLTRLNNLACLSAEDGSLSAIMGSVNDNNAHMIRIKRAPEFMGDVITLHFDEGRVLLGVRDEYTMPRAVTQKARDHLSITIMRGDDVIEHTNMITLLARPCKTLRRQTCALRRRVGCLSEKAWAILHATTRII